VDHDHSLGLDIEEDTALRVSLSSRDEVTCRVNIKPGMLVSTGTETNLFACFGLIVLHRPVRVIVAHFSKTFTFLHLYCCLKHIMAVLILGVLNVLWLILTGFIFGGVSILVSRQREVVFICIDVKVIYLFPHMKRRWCPCVYLSIHPKQ
jgi:hypothetical protein